MLKIKEYKQEKIKGVCVGGRNPSLVRVWGKDKYKIAFTQTSSQLLTPAFIPMQMRNV